ncbi:unnamed protein product, partial [Adineta steineri]
MSGSESYQNAAASSDEYKKAISYHQLGLNYCNQGDYENAIQYYEQGLEILQKVLPSNH